MTVLVGYSPHLEDVSALDLACQLARSDHTGVRALTVVPQGWPTPVARDTDREFERWPEEEGSAAAAAATAYLREHDDVPSQAEWVAARSVPPALIEHARAVGADLLVVGSGQEVAHGQIGITSKTDRLLHSSPVPVVVTPRGYQAGPGSRVRRISLAFRGGRPDLAPAAPGRRHRPTHLGRPAGGDVRGAQSPDVPPPRQRRRGHGAAGLGRHRP